MAPRLASLEAFVQENDPMITVIDNYDSFTYNLVQQIERLAGERVRVVRNDAFEPAALVAERPRAIVISPGPGTPARAGRMSEVLRRTGISFLFAPKLHPAMGAVVGVRRELGVRTIFNVLGPLTNPAFAKRQILGVYADHLVDVLAEVLLALGAVHAMVVHSRDGLDEISVSAPTRVCEVIDGEVRRYEVTPSDFAVEV